MPPAPRPRAAARAPDPLDQQLVAEQVRAHYGQIPAMAIAPTLGSFYTAWVLWGAVDNRYLVAGVGAVSLLSAARMLLYRRYSPPPRRRLPRGIGASWPLPRQRCQAACGAAPRRCCIRRWWPSTTPSCWCC